MTKTQRHAANYCEFKLSRDIKKNPGPTPVYIDPSKTIAAPYSQGYVLSASLTASESGTNIFLLCSTTVSASLIQI